MPDLLQPGAEHVLERVVLPEDAAMFPDEGLVHPVYSTFALARDAEWACRWFVRNLLQPGQAGVGSALSIRHIAPVPVGSRVRIVARLENVQGNRVWCSWQAWSGKRLVAEGEQEQRLVDARAFAQKLQELGPEQA